MNTHTNSYIFINTIISTNIPCSVSTTVLCPQVVFPIVLLCIEIKPGANKKVQVFYASEYKVELLNSKSCLLTYDVCPSVYKITWEWIYWYIWTKIGKFSQMCKFVVCQNVIMSFVGYFYKTYWTYLLLSILRCRLGKWLY